MNLREAHDLWQDRTATVHTESVGREADQLDVAKLVAEHRPHYRVVADDAWRETASQADWIQAYGHVRVTIVWIRWQPKWRSGSKRRPNAGSGWM